MATELSNASLGFLSQQPLRVQVWDAFPSSFPKVPTWQRWAGRASPALERTAEALAGCLPELTRSCQPHFTSLGQASELCLSSLGGILPYAQPVPIRWLFSIPCLAWFTPSLKPLRWLPIVYLVQPQSTHPTALPAAGSHKPALMSWYTPKPLNPKLRKASTPSHLLCRPWLKGPLYHAPAQSSSIGCYSTAYTGHIYHFIKVCEGSLFFVF